jgi:hypothetical protein
VIAAGCRREDSSLGSRFQRALEPKARASIGDLLLNPLGSSATEEWSPGVSDHHVQLGAHRRALGAKLFGG